MLQTSSSVTEYLKNCLTLELFKHLQSSECCRQSCSADCFKILPSVRTKFLGSITSHCSGNVTQPALVPQSDNRP